MFSLHNVARKFLHIATVIWLTLISLFLVTFFANLLVVQVKDLSTTILASVLHWFALFGLIQILLMIAVGIFLVLTLLSIIYVTIENVRHGGEPWRKYLRSVVAAYKGLNPTGIYQQSQALISVNVPLDMNFIHLRAMPDRPRYDIPSEQQRLLQELLQRPNMSTEEREEQIQHLRSIWFHSSQEQDLPGIDPEREVKIEEVLQRLKVTSPVAIILGAPGSGKSTTMRWLALHMARASRQHFYRLPDGLFPKQIPILIRISDYAKQLSSEDLTFEAFFNKYLAKFHSQLPQLLLKKLKQGHCLLLFDGLDEVAHDSLRRQVAQNIYDFISTYSIEKPKKKHYNRFIITSRIVGYEEGPFSTFAHYTLLELTDEQIDQFLTTWCPAVERHMARSEENRKELTASKKIWSAEAGAKQKELLLSTLRSSPGIRRLALNPLMLTILALIQRNGKTLPHRRVDLYRIATRTLLDNWNQDSSRDPLDINFAEQTLRHLAFRLHISDRLLIERNVKDIVRKSMIEFYEHPLTRSDESIVDNFIETIRRTSGVFVETGQGLFSFMHRTFQEYYAAQYLLLNKLPDQLRTFAEHHYRSAIWHEPLLLAIADKSQQDKKEASEVIKVIAETNDEYDSVLHRNLFFAVNSMVDCEVWSINKQLQQDQANRLFDLYGDAVGAGRYTQLQEDIEEVSLLWLRGQPQNTAPIAPLLEAWHEALCDPRNAMRQEGSAHLLMSIARELPKCPASVLLTLTSPLLQLADLQYVPCPPEVSAQFSRRRAHPSSHRVTEYAFVTLNLLDAAGPAGWLHDAWITWSKEEPKLLKQLTQHSLELDYLLTPSVLPGKNYSSTWAEHFEISEPLFKISQEWRQIGQSGLEDIHVRLLNASNTVRFPHAYLLKQLLEEEMAPSSAGQPWEVIWDTFLQKEMALGHSSTYQACLNLRILLCRENEEQRQQIASRLISALSTPNQEQMEALVTISSLYHNLDMLDERDPRNLRKSRSLFYLSELHCVLHLVYLLYLRYQRDLREFQGIEFDEFQVRRRDLDQDRIVGNLCKILRQGGDLIPTVLLALHNVLFGSSFQRSPQTTELIRQSIKKFQRDMALTVEHRILAAAVLQLIDRASRANSTDVSVKEEPGSLAMRLHKLRQQRQFNQFEIKEILTSCTYTHGYLSNEVRAEVGNAYSVNQVAWQLLSRQVGLDTQALSEILTALDNDNEVICAAAAELLRHNKMVPQDVQKKAAVKILSYLKDEMRSLRPLAVPDNREVWRLDDMLFETLQALAEQAAEQVSAK